MAYGMEYSLLGRTGLRISRIGYGGAALGNCYTPVETEDGIACVHKAIEEYGINYFDTSPSYGRGSLAETRLGEALAGGWREKIVLATKCGDYHRTRADGEDEFFRDYTPGTIRTQLELQLRRLRTDYVDVLQLHDINAANLDALLSDALPEMRRLQKEGKVRFLGITSIDLDDLRYILERTDDIDVVLTFGRYNLMDQELVGYFDDLREKKGFALLNCSVLFMGMLTRSFLDPENPKWQYIRKREGTGPAIRAIEEAAALCGRHGVDIGSLGVQFGCDCPFCDSTLISAGRTERLDQNMALISQPYDRALAEEVRGILGRADIMPWIFHRTGKQTEERKK